ncbi:MAG: hypothetical protein OQK04_02305 [Kangiellaceae bacterium]|nr:hypothetical protein [Kangiellaceae bacterium]MCW8997535.1 hypothetical protein [Kangiellaceae bacterium]
MDLKDFVKESLIQISKGITEANDELSGTGAMINPLNITINTENSQAYGRTGKPTRKEGSRVVENVDFDVAVVAEAGAKTNAGLKLSIASIGLGADGQSNTRDKSESRIQFRIPVVFPGVDNKA